MTYHCSNASLVTALDEVQHPSGSSFSLIGIKVPVAYFSIIQCHVLLLLFVRHAIQPHFKLRVQHFSALVSSYICHTYKYNTACTYGPFQTSTITMWSYVFSSPFIVGFVVSRTKQWLMAAMQGKISVAVGHVCVTPTVIYSYSNTHEQYRYRYRYSSK